MSAVQERGECEKQRKRKRVGPVGRAALSHMFSFFTFHPSGSLIFLSSLSLSLSPRQPRRESHATRYSLSFSRKEVISEKKRERNRAETDKTDRQEKQREHRGMWRCLFLPFLLFLSLSLPITFLLCFPLDRRVARISASWCTYREETRS